MDTALPQKSPFILDRNLAKANCTGNRVCTSRDTVVLDSLVSPNNKNSPTSLMEANKEEGILWLIFWAHLAIMENLTALSEKSGDSDPAASKQADSTRDCTSGGGV